jgi:hypothetical protein
MIKDILKTALQIWNEPKQGLLGSNNKDLDNKQVVEKLHKDGIIILQDYYDKDKVSILKSEVDRLFNENKEYIWSDAEDSDHRLHGSQRKSDVIKEFNQDPYFQQLADQFLGYASFPFSTLSARLFSSINNLGSGGGWHRDTPYESKQFKSIVYLTDVGPENGPFQYVNGTQNQSSLYRNIWLHNIKHGQHRFSDDEVKKILEDKYYTLNTYTAKAGTVILVNTFGLHRGMPIQKDNRYALTNYFYKKDGFDFDLFEKKFRVIK